MGPKKSIGSFNSDLYVECQSYKIIIVTIADRYSILLLMPFWSFYSHTKNSRINFCGKVAFSLHFSFYDWVGLIGNGNQFNFLIFCKHMIVSGRNTRKVWITHPSTMCILLYQQLRANNVHMPVYGTWMRVVKFTTMTLITSYDTLLQHVCHCFWLDH